MKRQKKIRRIALLTGGGDCPGLNAVIRAVTRSAIHNYGWEVIGVEDGFEGLIEGRFVDLPLEKVSGIISKGGTILGTSNRVDPFPYAKQVFKFFDEKKFDALVCVGGEGTMSFACEFAGKGMPIVGIPKTIDNDVPGTERTVGFYTAVHTATEAVDKLHTTAASHHRAMVIEVMGRHAGWLALASGVAAGADVILIPEIGFDLRKIFARVKERSLRGRRFTIMVVAEGAHAKGGKLFVKRPAEKENRGKPMRLGGIAEWLAGEIEKQTGVESRSISLGHLLRSGGPIYQDRLLATSFGCEATHRLALGERGTMVAWGKGRHLSIHFAEITKGPRRVPANHEWIDLSRSMGVTFGEGSGSLQGV